MFYLGGPGSAALTWRTWSRTESPGIFVIDFAHCILFICFAYFVSFLCQMHLCCFLSNRGRMTTSTRQPMQATHMLWLFLERWVRWRLTHFTVMSPFFFLFLNRYFFLFFLFIKFSIHHLVNFISYKSRIFFFFAFNAIFSIYLTLCCVDLRDSLVIETF